MKIVFFEVHDWEKDYLEKKISSLCPSFSSFDVHFYLAKLQDTNMSEWQDADVLCTFIYSEVSKDVLQKMPHLRYVITRSTGFNHIDIKAAKEKNVIVFNVPTYGENTVAEHTFALILNLSRKVHKSYLRTLQNDFRIDDLRGFDLQGKTLGVIGGGHIGMHVVKIAKGFGMHVLVQNRHEDSFLSGVLHFTYASLDDIYAKSDIISLHLPLTKETEHLIDKTAISKMKQGVILINTARGEIIDTDALLDGLQSGHIGGCGLDVIEGEKLVLEEKQLHKDENHKEQWALLYEDKQILQMPNVVFTPHNAFNSEEALRRILDTSAQNIKAVIESDLKAVSGNIVQEHH